MRKASFAVAACVLAVAVLAADPAPIPKEGNTSGTQILSGAVHVVPLGKDGARLSYGEWTRYNVRQAAEGTAQSVTKVSGTYKLPAASASR